MFKAMAMCCMLATCGQCGSWTVNGVEPCVPSETVVITGWQNPASATNWTWTSDGKEITLTGYNFASMDVVLPDTLDGLPVRYIHQEVFGMHGSAYDGEPITSVSGGNNMKSLGADVFLSCRELKTVDIEGVREVKERVFSGCTTLVSVNLPLATSIGEEAFSSCEAIKSVYIPSVTNLSYRTFSYCPSLNSVTFAKNAPAEPANLYESASEGQVTNYVESATASGWGETFGGMPVVRMPVSADFLQSRKTAG